MKTMALNDTLDQLKQYVWTSPLKSRIHFTSSAYVIYIHKYVYIYVYNGILATKRIKYCHL